MSTPRETRKVQDIRSLQPPPSDRSGLLSMALSVLVLLPVIGGGWWNAVHWKERVEWDKAPPVPGISATEIITFKDRGKKLRIGVTVKAQHDQYDDIHSLLEKMGLAKMGEGYDLTPVPVGQLSSGKNLENLDILFIGCAAEMAPPVAPTTSMEVFATLSHFKDKAYSDGVRDALRDFAERGGSIYASDWASSYLEVAFPDRIKIATKRFPRQYVRAQVMDPGLSDVIGPQINLVFDKDLWVAAEEVTSGTVYLRGNVEDAAGATEAKPLLVGFDFGKGRVIYTSFHNEKPTAHTAKLSEEQKGLLEYLVFQQVTAKISGEMTQVMVSQNFSLSKETLFSTGAGSPKTFRFDTKAGKQLFFVLAWNRPPGATPPKLGLKVTTPAGEVLESQGAEPPVVVRVPSSAEGGYSYEVVPIQVPYNNFPYVLQVGVKDQ